MKANRKFRGEDEAVSPVIAVILMVAITVVLAATVYVWVSGFGSQSNNPAKTISLTSAGAFDTTDFDKDYTIAAGTSGMKYTDLTFTLNGLTVVCDADEADAPNEGTAAAPIYGVSKNGGTSWQDCTSSAVAVTAGDLIRVDSDASFSGQTLRLLDTQANSVIYTLAVG